MKIIVFNIPAEIGGALSVLYDFYNEVKANKNKNIKWIFIIGKANLTCTENIEVYRYPWIKKSWLHRMFFDFFVAPKLIKLHNAEKVLSFQNMTIPRTNIKQIIYVHQPMPFFSYKFSIFNNKLLWFYQNIYSLIIYKSIKKAFKVIVQTEWMKKACISKTFVNEDKIIVVTPKIDINIDKYFMYNNESRSTFFYPSSHAIYKNHKIIIEACKILKTMNFEDYKIIFTLNGDESELISILYSDVKKLNLPVEFIGKISRDCVYNYYSNSVLLFPSYIETFGLPMLESKLHKGIILASDCPFSHEILDNYKNAYFFDPFNPEKLSSLIKNISSGTIGYESSLDQTAQNSINSFPKKSLTEIVISS